MRHDMLYEIATGQESLITVQYNQQSTSVHSDACGYTICLLIVQRNQYTMFACCSKQSNRVGAVSLLIAQHDQQIM